ncbi:MULTISPECIES: HPr family phosphocarrier protein [Priestia]|jgi:catabolite repression HPr-like protein|uniref:HPr-like protein Crh n=7 Tax=Bacillaceae TaxID=186817 RepID=D5DVG3_PRIM1|nr:MULTISPECIES: HPr family phosphocarrier protein [Priestia]AVX10895.1 HPr family phosphocarrier protein [Bacillus sp. Y-01]MBK0294755.1 HPr family phosphocarrier protein [Bacillus sp. S34]MBU8854736.1 HPr family phosphocarrier protein [Bacillus sp. FJAT-26377]MBZ5481914.1 HPr family phosphocarrier protein [Bacillus sp. T_4]MCF6798907.1 HPr family phosphocarrier protein [Bacillus sp. ET1]MCJ7984203.1 HPr family phosphocarrier protein [Priestia sp. OVL9]MCJ7991211.1 HPr family phosphocarrier
MEKQVEVKLKTGLQARVAALFVQEATRFTSDVYLKKDEKVVNAKSIMGLMSLAINNGSLITLIVEGVDEKEAMDALVAYVENDA